MCWMSSINPGVCPYPRAENGPIPIDIPNGQIGRSEITEKVLSILIVVHMISDVGAN